MAFTILLRDNGIVERLWRSIKYEEVYLRAYDTVAEARASIGRYLNFYNGRRPHSSRDRADLRRRLLQSGCEIGAGVQRRSAPGSRNGGR